MSALKKSIQLLCEPGRLQSVVQPVVRTSDNVVIGYEALARMPLDPRQPPNWWLDHAETLGMRGRLELACLAAAATLGDPPADRMLFVNVSPSTLTHPLALQLFDSLPSRLVIELTEQEAVADYDELRSYLAPWLALGVRFAVDDTGAGYSSLRHVIELQPDFLKLDRELVREVDRDRNRLALIRAVVAFASEVGTSVIAEGVETQAELDTLREAEVHLVQGYLLARPGQPWPRVSAEPTSELGPSTTRRDREGLDRLRQALMKAEDVNAACSLVVEHLFRKGQLLPSLYLESQGTLRCVAQRGLWQVLDGMPGSTGITGATWKHGRPMVVDNVATHPDYLEAVPGVVAEMCVPVLTDGKAVGALNVESLSPLPGHLLDILEHCANLLSERLREIGERRGATAWQRGLTRLHVHLGADGRRPDARQAAQIPPGGVRHGLGLPDLEHGRRAEGEGDGRALGAPTAGPVEPRARSDVVPRRGHPVLLHGRGHLGPWVCRHGIAAQRGSPRVAVLPLWARRQRLGTLIFAHSKPLRLTGDDIEPLEMLADTVAALLADHASPHRLRRFEPHASIAGAALLEPTATG